VRGFASANGFTLPDGLEGKMIGWLQGLAEFQILQILNLAYQDGGRFTQDDREFVVKEKERLVNKSGVLEIIDVEMTIDDIGGLDLMKEWLWKRQKLFEDRGNAVRFGVTPPKGIVIVGAPGCGKSLTAIATASLLKVPLVKMEVGQLLGRFVGDSEANMKRALGLLGSVSPCVMLIDEIEKAFSGVGGEGEGNDVTTRIFGHFLTWLQESDKWVFVVATANDLSKLPPELRRKGRFDEVFAVDLPNVKERREIFEKKFKRKNKLFSDSTLTSLAKSTEGYSGADIEAVVNEAILDGFLSEAREISMEILQGAVKRITPTSETMADKIRSTREEIRKIGCMPASKSYEGGRASVQSQANNQEQGAPDPDAPVPET
jgi:SpoVK/Ycf46/Vps4 family AAA+-type ATPase